jgi:uncharacterized protein
MNKDRILAQPHAHKTELKAAGIEKISIFGSLARGEATDNSDVDVVVRLSPESSEGGFAYFGRLESRVPPTHFQEVRVIRRPDRAGPI